mmetsp:Transcript_126846/g.223217  ORF Transcript_126846/g.223217 Transcript_126846/m.223217 type:complete len:319 (+) Transcript_126846:71-1027(+)
MLQIDTDMAPRSAPGTPALETPAMAQQRKEQRWRARKRLEDERKEAIRSAGFSDVAGDAELTSLCSGVAAVDLALETSLTDHSQQELDEEVPPTLSLLEALALLDAAGADPTLQEDAACSAVDTLDALVAFEHASASAGYPSRRLTGSFVQAVEDVAIRVNRAHAGFADFKEAVALRFANSSSSQYEQLAFAAWPKYAETCPALTARFQLAQSGLLTYSLGPREVCPDAAWELSGEGCWRLLRAVRDEGRMTEVLLEMRQGLEGSIPTHDGAVRSVQEPPCSLHVDLCECLRVARPGLEDVDEEEDEDEEDLADTAGC